eukprot:TRINITY_DN81073_c0_g1_i1.p1 TRINITY_DN81073_c0_g1~~TRINITY_DN81073_c0_g1_i1.p1  ORF type:complete len:795 (+),score=98.42 TRINITY_DN81073_c0_g1_i1:41-2425(+)
MECLVNHFLVIGPGQQLSPLNFGKTWVCPPPEVLHHTAFDPVLEDRFPRVDSEHAPLAPHIEKFCLPETIRVRHSRVPVPPYPRFYGFRMTAVDGSTMYVASLVFEEAIPQPLLHQLYPVGCGPASTSPMQLTRAIVLTSRWPFFWFFRDFLADLYDKTRSTSPVPIELYIAQLLQLELPPPAALGSVRLRFKLAATSVMHTLTFPPVNDLPLVDVPLRPLFESLPLGILITAFHALMLQRKLLLRSRDGLRLLSACEGLLALLFPFKWLHLAIPLLPICWPQFAGVVDAPVGYLIGVVPPPSTAQGSTDPIPPEVFVLDLDFNSLTLDEEMPLPPLPAKPHRKLVATLEALLCEFREAERTAPVGTARRVISGDSPLFPRLGIRQAFYRFMVASFQKYSSFIDSDKLLFQTEAFVSSHPEEDRAFFQEFCNTQAFDHFVAQRLDLIKANGGGKSAPNGGSPNASSSPVSPERISELERLAAEIKYFDDAIVAKQNRSKFHVGKKSLAGPASVETEAPPVVRTRVEQQPTVAAAALGPVNYHGFFPRLKEHLFPTDLATAKAHPEKAVSTSWQPILAVLRSFAAEGSHKIPADPSFPAIESGSTVCDTCPSTWDTQAGSALPPTELHSLKLCWAGDGVPQGTLWACHFDTRNRCHHCSTTVAEPQLRRAFRVKKSNTAYFTECGNCGKPFTPHFTVTLASPMPPAEKDRNSEGGDHPSWFEDLVTPNGGLAWHHQFVLLSVWTLMKEIANLQRQKVPADPRLRLTHPVTFWNVLLLFRMLHVPLTLLLPQWDST